MTRRLSLTVLLAVASAPCLFAVPLGAHVLVFQIEYRQFGGWFALALALVVVGIVVQELNWSSLSELSRIKVRPASAGPSGQPRAVRTALPAEEVSFCQAGAVIAQQLIAVLLFGLLLEAGRHHFRAAGIAYLAYAAGALVILATRWRRWTRGERLLLSWGWVPMLVAGVPWLVPAMKVNGPF